MNHFFSEANSQAGVGIRLQNLSKMYGGAAAVKDVNFSVKPGEFVSFLGPSGSGKTTTLMMVAGFVTPSNGEIFVDDRPVARLPPQKRNLGMVFQNYALFPHMTVAQNVAFPLRMRKVNRDVSEQRVRDALSMVKLTGFEERYPRQLSGGQQQRVALARSIVFEPRVLLMDEPLGALDKKLREHMQLEIKHIQARLGVTVVYVTHDQEEALTMSDRIVVMRDGGVEQVGTPRSLYDDPDTAFVADFLGESNLIEGIVHARSEGLTRVAVGNGLMLSGTANKSIPQPGAQIQACIRPERVSVQRADNAEGVPDGAWRGRVAEIVYVGDATKLRLDIEGLGLVAKFQNGEGNSHFSVGEEVLASWSPSSVKLLAE
ncbi:MAG: spermidine/putrescine transporter ATPase subunit [Microvirga sp.]|jgi:spermidine/putrescine ABC transporter ATP-binding subunit|nr:spermidine/putrescine transporter ATPase subunit [Microvirga sp.]